MKKNLYLLCTFSLTVFYCKAQETTQPIPKSNRIILHVDDTTGLFTQLGRIFVDSGYDIDIKDRELGILRAKNIYSNQFTIRAIFRDSTITFYATLRPNEYIYVIRFTKWRGTVDDMYWNEMLKIGGMLKPKAITYSRFE